MILRFAVVSGVDQRRAPLVVLGFGWLGPQDPSDKHNTAGVIGIECLEVPVSYR